MAYRDDLTAALHRASTLEEKVKELEESRTHDQERIAKLKMGTDPEVLEELRAAQRRAEELEMKVDELTQQLEPVTRLTKADVRWTLSFIGVVFFIATFLLIFLFR